jgi:hypothetical protein
MESLRSFPSMRRGFELTAFYISFRCGATGKPKREKQPAFAAPI